MLRVHRIHLGLAAGLAWTGLAVGREAAAPSELARQVVDLTGSRTKIVWERGSRDDYGVLMCFDTAEGKERVVLPNGPKVKDPKLSADGTRIFFTAPEQTSYVVNWDGSGLKELFKGRFHYIMGVARDAAGVEWVYVADSQSAEAVADIKAKGIQASEDSGLALYRHRLDNLSVKELVWDKVPFNRRLAISADGAAAFGEFPWPNCGVARLPNDAFTMVAQGCNANLAPDASGMFFNLIGDHRHIKLYDRNGGQKAQVAVNTLPGNEKDPKRAVWRPRWSNDIRFITVQSADLGPDADISIGRFDEGFTKIEAWVRIADTPHYDADGLAWIEPVIPLGAKLTENLECRLLKDLVGKLEKSAAVQPVVAELEAVTTNAAEPAKAEEAKAILDHVRRWAEAQLEKAKAYEATDPPAAVEAYEAFAKRFKGTEWGTAAAGRVEAPAMEAEVKAWKIYEKAVQTAGKLQEVDGATANATDPKWLAKNQTKVASLKAVARTLEKSHAETVAWKKMQELLAQYEIPLAGGKKQAK
jgi:hypothetical protein